MKLGLFAIAIGSALSATAPMMPAAAADLSVTRRIVETACRCLPHRYRYARRYRRWAVRHFHMPYAPYWLLTPPWATSFAAVPDEE